MSANRKPSSPMPDNLYDLWEWALYPENYEEYLHPSVPLPLS